MDLHIPLTRCDVNPNGRQYITLLGQQKFTSSVNNISANTLWHDSSPVSQYMAPIIASTVLAST